MKILLVALAVLVALPAWAQSEMKSELPASSQDRPWAKGVSPDAQKAANELFRQGNDLLKESLFVQAATKYREALKRWDHPGIHYNLALALLNLDRPVEVFGELEEAMKYGDAPLDPDKFAHAKRYRALIEKQLARVAISCETPGASVSMDGQPLFTAPGRYESLVRVGQHTIVATKTGFVPTQKTPILLAGQKHNIALTIYTADELTQYRRRWANAMPWSVLAAGVVVAGVGGIMHWQASEAIKSYDSGVTACGAASATGGCVPNASLTSKKETGDSLQIAAYAAYGIGAVAVAVGGVLAYLNRAKPYRVEPDKADKVAWTPLIGPSGAGLSATVHF
ncbi:MAG TPA: hypothetical protein VII38_08530 [Polyangia bacterium]|jgi:tetratricopeptide (TPR) repeat protein